MPTLKPVQIVPTQEQQETPDLPRTCDACGTVVQDGSQAINIMIQIGVAGHPAISPFQCPQEEHWACSLDCWKTVAHACIDEHMFVVLSYMHDQVQANGMNRTGEQNG